MPHTYLHTYTTTAQLCPSGSPDKNATDVTAQRSYYYCLGSADPQLYTKLRTIG